MNMKKARQIGLLLLSIVILGLFLGANITSIESLNDVEAFHNTENEIRADSNAALAASQEAEITTPVWESVFDWPNDAYGGDVVRTSDNGFCFTGYVKNPSYADIILVRTDSDGQQLWNRTYLTPDIEYTHSVIECSDGGFAIAGTYMNMSVGGGVDGWLLKTNSTGHHEWNMTYDETSYFLDIIERSEGGFLLTGQGWESGAPESAVVVVRVDSNGNEIWKEHFASCKASMGRRIFELGSDEIMMIGNLESDTQSDSQILKATDYGGFAWLDWYRILGTGEDEEAQGVIACGDGGFLITGGAIRDSAVQLWVCKVDQDGNQVWSKTYPSYHVGRDIVSVEPDCYAIVTDNVIVYIDGEGYVLRSSTSGVRYTESLVRCENSELVVGGRTTTSDIKLARIPWLAWNQSPADIDSEYFIPFELDMNATCSRGIASWFVNNTSLFHVDGEGVLTNITTLAVGQYTIEITVNDTLDNKISQTFTLTVEDTTAPTWRNPLENQFAEAGTPFSYDVDAEDASSVSEWSINSTICFQIDEAGTITNSIPIGIGYYGIEVHARDPYGNELIGVFTVHVIDTTSPVWVLSPTEVEVVQGELIVIYLVASDFSGIATWVCNDTLHFQLTESFILTTSSCKVESVGALAVGTYGVHITVIDNEDNSASTTFSVIVEETSSVTTTSTTTTTTTVTETTTPGGTTSPAPITGEMILLAGSGWGFAIVMIILLLRRRQG